MTECEMVGGGQTGTHRPPGPTEQTNPIHLLSLQPKWPRWPAEDAGILLHGAVHEPPTQDKGTGWGESKSRVWSYSVPGRHILRRFRHCLTPPSTSPTALSLAFLTCVWERLKKTIQVINMLTFHEADLSTCKVGQTARSFLRSRERRRDREEACEGLGPCSLLAGREGPELTVVRGLLAGCPAFLVKWALTWKPSTFQCADGNPMSSSILGPESYFNTWNPRKGIPGSTDPTACG